MSNNFGCGYFIWAVGFGQGPLRVIEDTPRSTPMELETYFLIQGTAIFRFLTTGELLEQLTFLWFKQAFICPEKPWFCLEDLVHDEFKRRRLNENSTNLT